MILDFVISNVSVWISGQPLDQGEANISGATTRGGFGIVRQQWDRRCIAPRAG